MFKFLSKLFCEPDCLHCFSRYSCSRSGYNYHRDAYGEWVLDHGEWVFCSEGPGAH